jgi:hypothetical protein
MIAIEPQFSVFLDNRPGTLARTCQALSKAGINIKALSISDTVDHAVVRFVVNDVPAAAKVFEQLHVLVQKRDVVVIDVPNRPGEVARIAERLAEAGINIEYAYGTWDASQPASMFVLRTNNIEETIDVLS